MQTDRKTSRQTDRQTGRQINRHIDIQTDRQTGRLPQTMILEQFGLNCQKLFYLEEQQEISDVDFQLPHPQLI